MGFLELPNWHAFGVMLLTVAALVLFSRERVPIETTSILVLALLAISFTIFPFDADGERLEPEAFFLGFGNDALIAICALMIASYGLVRTGALVPIGRWTAALWNISPSGAMLGMLASTALISAFINNTPQVVMMIPILVGVALRTGMAASKTLMPMTFSAQLGGILTPIGTGLNLLIISTAAGLGLPRFGMFDFFVPGVIVASVGVAYLWLVAPRLLPERTSDFAESAPRVFSAVLHVTQGSFADGKPFSEILQKTDGRMKITRIERGENLTLSSLLGVAPEPFVLAVLFGVNFGVLHTHGRQLQSARAECRRLSIQRFVRAGFPLTILMCIATALVLPVFFPFAK